MTIRWLARVSVLLLLANPCAWGGPPFFTDDPEPVDLHHWEIYFASQYMRTADTQSGAAPFIDANYGAYPNLHIHAQIPMAFNHADGGPTFYGYGDTEIGTKFRFIHETPSCPQMAIYPAVDFPTGDENRGLGNGRTQAFLPLWIQKIWGPWSTFGGGGYWINPGEGHKNWIYAGWVIQRELSKSLALGFELFHRTPDAVDTDAGNGFTIGGTYNFNEHYHLLLAMGRDFTGPNHYTQYLALQWTFGKD